MSGPCGFELRLRDLFSLELRIGVDFVEAWDWQFTKYSSVIARLGGRSTSGAIAENFYLAYFVSIIVQFAEQGDRLIRQRMYPFDANILHGLFTP